MSVRITEEFDSALGQYTLYEAANLDLQPDLLKRKHKNIRSFSNAADTVPQTMSTIALTMDTLDTWEMQDFEGNLSTVFTETWSTGAYGPDPTLNDRSTLRLTLPIGTTTTTSTAQTIDFSDFPDGEVSVALPNFPATSLDLDNSYLTLASGTLSVRLSLAGLANGNVEAKWPVANLNSFHYTDLAGTYGGLTGTYGELSDVGELLTEVSTVSFTFVATAACTVTVAALRILSPDWTPTTLDMNTLYQRLEPTVTRTGTISTTTFPKMWRASETPGDGDPLPINTKLALNFYTGSGTQDNSASFFFRGRREDFLTQLDLDGTYTGPTLTFGTNQALLDEYGVQPDYGRAMYNPRPQDDYDTMAQTALDSFSQAEMERQPDLISEAWIEVQLRFGLTDLVTIRTTETDNDTEVVLPASFDPDELYLATVDVVDDSVRVRVYHLDEFGQVDRDNVVFDSTEIRNDFLIKRRKGRVGWAIDLQDGDAYVNSVRSRGLMFNEFISQNFESFTPVVGARLVVGATPDALTPLNVLPYNGAQVDVDIYNTRSKDGSAKVTAAAATGIQSQSIAFDDFENSEITFDFYHARDARVPELYLLNERGLFIPLGMPKLVGDTWNSIRVQPLRAYMEQTGAYRILILQESGSAVFWVDNFTLRQRAISWSGRSTLYNPWGRGRNEWTEFRSLVNSDLDGVMFPDRDHYLQIRGQALLQDAHIDRIYTKPKYAELGRLVWNVNRKYAS